MGEINELTELAHDGGRIPLTTTPVVGMPIREYPDVFVAGTEPLACDEIRVTVLGSGGAFTRRSQASASLLIEVGNTTGDFFFFDLGSGSLANFSGLGLPVSSTTKVFLSHLHADHVGDMPTLLWSLARAGRRDPVEVWGPAGEHAHLGTSAYLDHLERAHAWDTTSLIGLVGPSGVQAIPTEVPYEWPEVVYQRNGVTISSFPVIHVQEGAVGYRLEYAGRSVVFSGDTRPCRNVVEACDGADLLIHDTFPSAAVIAQQAGFPRAMAETIVNTGHTTPVMAGEVFERAGARMSAMWHLAVDHATVGPVYSEMRTRHDGPVVICQDLTVFNITRESVVARQAAFDPYGWPVVGRSNTPVALPPAAMTAPAWWADALITDMSSSQGGRR